VAQLRHDAITEDDLVGYVEDDSDFAFEMTTLQLLKSLPFKCEHGGTYKDSVTGVARQFDIRAHTRVGSSWFYLAIECKNVRENFPLLISCVPRHGREASHDVLLTFQPDLWPQSSFVPFEVSTLAASVESGGDDPYRSRGPVGKACVQVGRDSKGEFQDVGKDIYERWSQSLSSAHELVARASRYDRARGLQFSVVVPFVVVPDDRLWQVTYDDNGRKTSSPTRVDRVSYYVDHAVSLGAEQQYIQYRISHVEFVTQRGLESLIKWMISESGRLCFTPSCILEKYFSDQASAARSAAVENQRALPSLPDFQLPDLSKFRKQ
jgi:hypothetical protein